MNEIGMTKKDYEEQIKKEERYLARCKRELLDVQSRIRATEKAIQMWKGELKKVSRKNGKYEGKTFRDLPCQLIPYGDKCYRSWWVEVNPGEQVKFAEISLYNAMDENGDCDNDIDCSIAYYVGLDDDVQSSIEDYND